LEPCFRADGTEVPLPLLTADQRDGVHYRVRALIALSGRLAENAVVDRLATGADVELRPPGPGDLGWVIERHGALYTAEQGWDATFEALVARIVADFAQTSDPAMERCWIAHVGGVRAGCIFCVRRADGVAQLRCLLVEPWARGFGVGRALVDACVGFARERGYAEIVLWTNDALDDARRQYERAGFVLVEDAPTDGFGKRAREQTWKKALR
jgi:GNAT superfamily N-acetyltransferase